MLVSEIFLSIQGESTYAGLPCVFVRLAGCNLSCAWCDTPYARAAGDEREMTVGEAVGEVKGFKGVPLVEITGGEPLLQEETGDLAARLLELGYAVLIETNGSVGMERVPKGAVKIVDVKCPSSGQAGSFLIGNLGLITPEDEVKFVIGDRADYDYAKKFMEEYIMDRTSKVLFAPVRGALDAAALADWVLRDRLSVRLQLQLHSYIWPDERGR